MDYPLSLRFKIVALAPQIFVTDARGLELMYVHQKLFKLKEAITVYADRSKTTELYRIAADRVLDFRARYAFTDASGAPIGAIKRQGARSLWKATYDVFTGPEDQISHRIGEDNPWIKLADGLLDQIPVLGAFTGYFLNPSYSVMEVVSGQPVTRVTKHRTFMESRFEIRPTGAALTEAQETSIILAILTMVLLERSRG